MKPPTEFKAVLHPLAVAGKRVRKTHLANGDGRPLCGGRRAGGGAAWQTGWLGMQAISCLACLRIAVKRVSE